MHNIPFVARPVQAVCFATVVTFMATGLARAEDSTTHYQSASGVAGYIGVVPAEIVKGHPVGHTERVMHGGIPAQVHEHHLIVALFDSSTGARISDAKLNVTVFGPGNTLVYDQSHPKPWSAGALVLPRTPLEPMQIAGTTTYGGFFQLPKPTTYTIQVVVQRPGGKKTATLNFVYDSSADER